MLVAFSGIGLALTYVVYGLIGRAWWDILDALDYMYML